MTGRVVSVAEFEVCDCCKVEPASGPDGQMCAGCAAEVAEYVAELARETAQVVQERAS